MAAVLAMSTLALSKRFLVSTLPHAQLREAI
jgi:hypothetical protein